MQLFLTCVSLEVPHQLRLLSGLGIQGLERVGNRGGGGVARVGGSKGGEYGECGRGGSKSGEYGG